MAEVGIIGSIVGCINFGARISLGLYEFAAQLHSAPIEISTLANDITVFCSVLRQVEAVFQDEKSLSLSEDAISTIEGITTRCKGCLEELGIVLDSVKSEASQLKTSKGDRKDEAWGLALASVSLSPEIFLTDKRKPWKPSGIGGVIAAPEERGASMTEKIRWILSRPKITLLRQNLDSMTITLHLMLTTIQISGCGDYGAVTYGQVRKSIELVAENLVLAQQLAVQQLEAAETSVTQEVQPQTRRPISPITRRRKDPRSNSAIPTEQLSVIGNAAFLKQAVACDVGNGRFSTASFASAKSTLLATKWIVSGRYSRSVLIGYSRRVSQINEDVAETHGADGRGVTNSLQTWEKLSTQWRDNVSTSMTQMQGLLEQKGDEPIVSQLCSHISTLSTTCGSQFKALHELEEAHDMVRADYEKFLKANVENQEKAVELLEKKEALVLELRSQHTADLERMIAEVADTHSELEQLGDELDATRSARDHLSKEADDLKVELRTRMDEVIRLTNLVEEQTVTAEELSREMQKLRDEMRQRENDAFGLRKQIANEKVQRLKAIRYLTADGAGDAASIRSDLTAGKDSNQNWVENNGVTFLDDAT